MKQELIIILTCLVLVIGCGVGIYFSFQPITYTGLVISSEWQSQWNREVVSFNDGTGIYLATNTPLSPYATYKFELTNNKIPLTTDGRFWKLIKEVKPADNFTSMKIPILPQEKVQADYVISGADGEKW